MRRNTSCEQCGGNNYFRDTGGAGEPVWKCALCGAMSPRRVHSLHKQLSGEKLSHRDLTPSQKKSLRFILRFYRDGYANDGVTSLRYTLKGTDYGDVWVYVKSRRSDCHPSSPRALACEINGSFVLGRKGKITVYRSDVGIGYDNSHYVAKMLRASPRPKPRI